MIRRLARLTAFVAALALATPAAAEPPRDRALQQYKAGRYDAAATAFAHATERAPDDVALWVWRAVSEYRARRPLLALQSIAYARSLAPDDPMVRLWEAEFLGGIGQTEQAEARYREVLAEHPTGRAADVARRRLRLSAATREVLAARAPSLEKWVADLARRYNRRLTAAEAERIAAVLIAYARRYNVDPLLVAAVVGIESGFQPRATSWAGAAGLGQLMPATARSLGITDSYDVVQNLYGTVRVLQGHLYRYGYQNLHLALAAYNAGSGAVRAYGGVPPFSETQWYVYNVSALYARYRRTQVAGPDRLACRPGGC